MSVYMLVGSLTSNLTQNPASTGIFPIIEKEDSFSEDTDLKTESELIKRCTNAMDQVLHVEATLDGQSIISQRVLSPFFDLNFPENNVYDVQPGVTRSACDGYWIFLEPLSRGEHYIEFTGEAVLEDTVAQQERKVLFDVKH